MEYREDVHPNGKSSMSSAAICKGHSAVRVINGSVGGTFHTRVGVRQNYLMFQKQFNIFLAITKAFEDHNGTVSIAGSNLCFVNDIGGLEVSEEFVRLIGCLEATSS